MKTSKARPRQALRSVDEAASHMGLSRATLWRIIQRGDLARVRIGSRTLIRQCDIDAFIDSAVVPKQH